jgi:hypothetical protein
MFIYPLMLFMWVQISDMLSYSLGAVPWLRRLVTGRSLRRAGVAPGSVHVEFVVDKEALGQICLRVLRFSFINIIQPWLSIFIYRLGDEY